MDQKAKLSDVYLFMKKKKSQNFVLNRFHSSLMYFVISCVWWLICVFLSNIIAG